MFKQKYQFKNYNWFLLLNVVLVSVFGVVFINSANSSYTSKQLFGLILSLGVMIVVSLIDYNVICDYASYLYLLNFILLALVHLIGVSVKGAKRWISLGVINIQPSELSKIIMIIVVAIYIQEHQENLNTFKNLFRLALLCAVPLFLIVTETDLSTTLDMTIILLGVIFIGGLSSKIIKTAIIIFVPLFAIFIWYIQTPNQVILQDYQVTRIMTFLNPSEYSDSSGYQQENSVMAIGSGQLYGKGLKNNTISDVSVTVTDTGLVSEQQTDFIFSVVGEETGFLGSVILIALLALIVVQCLIIAFYAKNLSGRLIAVGMAGLIGFQSFINIGVATQLLPNTGLPLPFVSYGLTSLISCMGGMGLVLNVGLQRHY